MENVNFREVDSTEEICKVFNRVIDNQNQIEGKLLQLIAASKVKIPLTDEEKATKKAAKKEAAAAKKAAAKAEKEAKSKGFTMIKTMLATAIMAVMLLVGVTNGYVARDINDDIASNHVLLAQYLRDTIGAGTFAFTPRSAPTAGSISQGLVYFDSSVNLLKVSLDGTNFSTIDTAGGVSLDSAYDFGSAGGGRAILATDGAVAISSTDADTAFLLTLGANPGSSAALGGIEITNNSNSTEAGIEFENSGSGADILGTAGWSFTKAGVIAFTGGTLTTGDFLFDDTFDVSWDTSKDQLLFEDNAVLGLGGAHDADGDFTFKYDATDLNMEAATANDDFRMGETTHFDFSIHGETNTNVVKFDTDNSALLCIFDGFDLRINDDDVVIFGDSVASDSFSVYFDETTDNLLIVANTANDQVQFGDATTSSTDVKMMAATDGDLVLFDSSEDELFFEDADLVLNEGAQLRFEWSDNATDWTADLSTEEVLTWLPTETDDTQSFNIGNATKTSDFRLFGLDASTIVFDASADLQTNVNYDILLDDASTLIFGSGSDFSMYSDTADTLEIDPGAAGDQFLIGTSDTDAVDLTWFSDVSGAVFFLDEESAIANFGADDFGLDAKFFGDTASSFMLWDASGNTNGALIFDAADIEMGDGDFIQFGDGADLTVSATTTTTTLTMAAGSDMDILDTDDTLSKIILGLAGGTHGLDLQINSITANDDIIFDAALKTLTFDDIDITMITTAILTLDEDSNLRDMMDATGTKVDTGTPVYFIFNPTTGEELNFTVPAGVDLLILDAWGYKTAAAGVGAEDQWDIQNNSINSIFSIAELAGVSDTDRVAFDGLIDTEYEIEAGETLTLVAGETSDDDGADGIITVVGIYKLAD